MHGIIFVELKKYADARLGAAAWPQLLGAAGLGKRLFLAVDTYPDGELLALVKAAAALAKQDVEAVIEDFGAFIAPDLLAMYASLVAKEWRTLDLLEHVEETIHRLVRARNTGAEPPEIGCVRSSPTSATITYGSQRRLCSLAKGIVRGLGKHYGETIAISEPQCMHRGAKRCQIDVRLT